MTVDAAFEIGRFYHLVEQLVGARVNGTYSVFKLLSGLRGFWPMSAMSAGGRPQDFGGQALDLSYNGGAKYGYDGLAPYAAFDGAGDYFDVGDTSALDISGAEAFVEDAAQGLTMGGWFYHNALTGYQGYVTKWGDPGQKSYGLYKNSTQAIRFLVTNDGTATTQLSSSVVPTTLSWMFIVARYRAGLSLDLYVNGTRDTLPSAPGSLFNSSRDFRIGNQHGSSSWYLDGRASLCFLCATALSDEVVDNLFSVSRLLFGV